MVAMTLLFLYIAWRTSLTTHYLSSCEEVRFTICRGASQGSLPPCPPSPVTCCLSPCAGDPLEGGPSSGVSSSDKPLPVKRPRTSARVGPASEDEEDDGDKAWRPCDASDSEASADGSGSSAESGSEAGSDASDESELSVEHGSADESGLEATCETPRLAPLRQPPRQPPRRPGNIGQV